MKVWNESMKGWNERMKGWNDRKNERMNEKEQQEGWMNEWGVLITLLIDSLYLISGKYRFNYWTEEIQFSQGLIY